MDFVDALNLIYDQSGAPDFRDRLWSSTQLVMDQLLKVCMEHASATIHHSPSIPDCVVRHTYKASDQNIAAEPGTVANIHYACCQRAPTPQHAVSSVRLLL